MLVRLLYISRHRQRRNSHGVTARRYRALA